MNTQINALRRPRCLSALAAITPLAITCCLPLALEGTASAQWISFTDQTGTRMPTGGGQNNPATSTLCPEEKDYTWGDVDHDGDLDVVCARKRPLSCTGGRASVLFMNENGVLIDRTSTKAAAALNGPPNGVPTAEGVSQGFLDPTNVRTVALTDVNNDGWLDIVTATTMSEGQQRYIGYPRVYMNLGESGGVWQGFRYEYARIPSMAGATHMPRFCAVAAGDVTGDGYVDLYLVDYDGPEFCYCTNTGGQPGETADFNDKLLVNQGASNPGFFNDEGSARIGAGALQSQFGAHCLIADMTGDGIKDIVKITTLVPPNVVMVLTNPAATIGTGFLSKTVYNGAPYSVSTDDLNGDGRLDLIIGDDTTDRYGRNDGNDAQGQPNITNFGLINDGFSGQSAIVDFDNDGWKDVVITDQDLDTDYVASRRTHIYHNNGAGNPNPQLTEVTSPAPIIPFNVADAVYNLATFDIDADGWRDVVLGRGGPGAAQHSVGSTIVLMNNGKPGITFTYPGGRPTNLTPLQTTNFNVQLTANHGGSITGTPAIFRSVDGSPFGSLALTPLGGGLYQVTLPALPCGSSVRYYISAQNGATHVDPPAEGNVYGSTTPATHYSASAGATTQVLASENFEGAAPGWTVQNDGGLTSGAWELGDPNNTWNEGFKASPEDDATAAGTRAYVTGLGSAGGAVSSHDVDGGSTHLVSPTFDLTGSTGVVTFKRWFYSSTAGDVLQVSVSNNNGASWTNVVAFKPHPVVNWNGYSAEYTQTAWLDGSFVVSDYVSPTSQVQVRFSVNDTTPAGFVEAGIDDFVVNKPVCGGGLPCPANIVNTGTSANRVDVDDLLAVISGWGNCPAPPALCPANIVNTGTSANRVDVDDLLAVISAWGNCP